MSYLNNYNDLTFKDHLRRIVVESYIFLNDKYRRGNDEIMSLDVKLYTFNAGAHFRRKYGFSITVGDISQLETNFDETYEKLKEKWTNIQEKAKVR